MGVLNRPLKIDRLSDCRSRTCRGASDGHRGPQFWLRPSLGLSRSRKRNRKQISAPFCPVRHERQMKADAANRWLFACHSRGSPGAKQSTRPAGESGRVLYLSDCPWNAKQCQVCTGGLAAAGRDCLKHRIPRSLFRLSVRKRRTRRVPSQIFGEMFFRCALARRPSRQMRKQARTRFRQRLIARQQDAMFEKMPRQREAQSDI